MIRGLVYLTGLATLGIIGLIAAVAFRVDTWPWRNYAEDGREYLVGKLEEAEFEALPTGEAPGPHPMPVAPHEVSFPQPVVIRHVVVRGDTLYRIAGRYYGDPEKWRLIAAANDIRKPSDLRVGKVLLVPVASSPATNETAWPAAPERTTLNRVSWPESRLAMTPAFGTEHDTEGE